MNMLESRANKYACGIWYVSSVIHLFNIN